jgi:hypothetical protein
MEVQNRVSLFIRKEGPDGQNLLNALEHVDHGNNGVTPVLLRPHYKTASVRSSTQVHYHCITNVMFPAKALDSIG